MFVRSDLIGLEDDLIGGGGGLLEDDGGGVVALLDDDGGGVVDDDGGVIPSGKIRCSAWDIRVTQATVRCCRIRERRGLLQRESDGCKNKLITFDQTHDVKII